MDKNDHVNRAYVVRSRRETTKKKKNVKAQPAGTLQKWRVFSVCVLCIFIVNFRRVVRRPWELVDRQRRIVSLTCGGGGGGWNEEEIYVRVSHGTRVCPSDKRVPPQPSEISRNHKAPARPAQIHRTNRRDGFIYFSLSSSPRRKRRFRTRRPRNERDSKRIKRSM